MAQKSLRQKYIDTILKNKFGDDEPKHDGRNLAFLETLSLDELAKLADYQEEMEEELNNM